MSIIQIPTTQACESDTAPPLNGGSGQLNRESAELPIMRGERRINVDQVKLSNERYLQEYSKFKGRHVQIKVGKYKGRVAIIKGMLMDNERGMTFCCHVLRHDLSETLNSDGESRWYRPVSHFRLLRPLDEVVEK